MPKIRGIKPEFWTDEKTFDVDPVARLLFIGLWTLACDNGHVEDRPRQIKARLFPADAIDVDALLAQLADASLLVRADGVLTIPNLRKHQRIDSRWFSTCDLPGCTKDSPSEDRVESRNSRTTRRGHVGHTSGTRRAHAADVDVDVEGDFEGEGDYLQDSCAPEPHEPPPPTDADAPEGDVIEAELIAEIPEQPDRFEELWRAWPAFRRKNKPKAREAWVKALKRTPPHVVLEGFARYTEALAKGWEDEQFVPYPQKWLNQESWANTYGPRPQRKTYTRQANDDSMRRLQEIADRREAS